MGERGPPSQSHSQKVLETSAYSYSLKGFPLQEKEEGYSRGQFNS